MHLTLTPYHAKYFSHELTRRAATNRGRLSMARFDAAVDLKPHQFWAERKRRLLVRCPGA